MKEFWKNDEIFHFWPKMTHQIKYVIFKMKDKKNMEIDFMTIFFINSENCSHQKCG